MAAGYAALRPDHPADAVAFLLGERPRRVLDLGTGTGRVIGLVWNTRDEEVPWVAALGRALAAEARGHEAGQGVVVAFARALGARVEHHRSAVVQRLTPAQVRAVLDTHGCDLVDLPYRTDAHRLLPA